MKLSKKLKKPKKSISIKKLELKLRSILYPLIKLRDGNTCISCGKLNLIGKDWQAGHYIKAELCNLKYRYNELNIHSQCSHCNKWKAGNSIAYRNALIRMIDEKEVKKLDQHYNDKLPMNFNSRAYLEELIAYYKTVVKLADL